MSQRSKSRRASRSPSRSARSAAAAAAPHEHVQEFGGPAGNAATILALPFVIVLLVGICDKDTCLGTGLGNLGEAATSFQKTFAETLATGFSWVAVQVVLGWLAFHVALERLLPADVVDGVALADGAPSPARPRPCLSLLLPPQVLPRSHYLATPPRDTTSRCVTEGRRGAGSRLKYRLNAHLALWISLALLMHGCPTGQVRGKRSAVPARVL